MNSPQLLKSVYIHGERASHLHGKAKSFFNLFWTIGIPWDINPYDAVDNFAELTNQDKKYIIIVSSAGALPAIEIARKYPERIQKLVFFNPAISLNIFPREHPITVYDSDDCFSRSAIPENITLLKLVGDHSFTWMDDMINKIVEKEITEGYT
ncbi:MAG: hypothetical protein ACD_71C00196G0005 [uncultured bacterium (gcode 4)]|uniref:Alpha/beta hydrolase n=1 Tax=uncultured bacterium (gcode 4) TaxID=1234023 RepID=K1Z4R6_9BACT|nr:MAG: hypothetical protein ACD_71C00196G0005 [uncultured bacterium (gcode 4)]